MSFSTMSQGQQGMNNPDFSTFLSTLPWNELTQAFSQIQTSNSAATSAFSPQQQGGMGARDFPQQQGGNDSRFWGAILSAAIPVVIDLVTRQMPQQQQQQQQQQRGMDTRGWGWIADIIPLIPVVIDAVTRQMQQQQQKQQGDTSQRSWSDWLPSPTIPWPNRPPWMGLPQF
jgi:hypothetical protein